MTGTAPSDRPLTANLAVSPRCLVVVKRDGLFLQQSVFAPIWPLDAIQLDLLAALDEAWVSDVGDVKRAVAERAGVPEGDLNDVLFRLRLSTNLEPGPKAEHLPVADHPSLPPLLPFDLDATATVVLRLPFTLRLVDGRYEIIDHEGYRLARLSPAEAAALGVLGQPTTARTAFEAQRASSGANALDEDGFAHLLGLVDRAGLLVVSEAEIALVDDAPEVQDRAAILRAVFDRHAAAQTERELERQRATGRTRTKVIPVSFDASLPAALGLIMAHAKAFDGGRLEEHYDFRTDWVWSDDRLPEFTAEPAIYLFSNYLWSHARCLAVSERIKELSPGSITIHGGPDTPKYEKDAEEHFVRYPHVDITVRGEGEMTTAHLLDVLSTVIGPDEPDLSVLAQVPGISYRDGAGSHRTEDRERITDLDSIPSPFLTGLFDVFADVPEVFVTLETNRGCPYGCTFCDWGSATTSRIRKFDLDRVFAEIDWASELGVESISIADANFGILARDVEIAEHVAEARRRSGRPRGFGVSYAKNTVKHVRPIISVLADAGIMTQGVLSLQTMDTDTLHVIRRSNIKTEQYDQLADEMRQAHLPLMVELMMGLPGMTLDSFADDLQQCIDRGLPARINFTTLLVNSPMNDPEYLAEHQIETDEPLRAGHNAAIVSTSTFTREDHAAMHLLRADFMFFENWSVLRHVAPFVRRETGRREIDLYRLLRAKVIAEPWAWPALDAMLTHGPSLMAPPHSWALVIAELRRFLVTEASVEPSSALDAVLTAQRALLPSLDRTFPIVLELEHDLVGWTEQIMAVKASGHLHDWDQHVPRLGELGPGSLAVDDPDDITGTSLGINFEMNVVGMNWEFDSPLSRASIAATQFMDWATDSMLTPNNNDAAPGGAVPVSLSRPS